MNRIPLLALTGLLMATGTAAQADARLHADDWNHPRSGSMVRQLEPVRETVQAWNRQPEKLIVIRYPGGEQGELWAGELQDWLVALGVPSSQLRRLAGGTGGSEWVRLELHSPSEAP